LGIPNTAHFANITLIEDAIQLWDKLKVTREVERFKPDNEVLNFVNKSIFNKIIFLKFFSISKEEFEDSIGNVLNKKMHDDLKRQGLL
jgi:splicing factor 3A subunit 3